MLLVRNNDQFQKVNEHNLCKPINLDSNTDSIFFKVEFGKNQSESVVLSLISENGHDMIEASERMRDIPDKIFSIHFNFIDDREESDVKSVPSSKREDSDGYISDKTGLDLINISNLI